MKELAQSRCVRGAVALAIKLWRHALKAAASVLLVKILADLVIRFFAVRSEGRIDMKSVWEKAQTMEDQVFSALVMETKGDGYAGFVSTKKRKTSAVSSLRARRTSSSQRHI